MRAAPLGLLPSRAFYALDAALGMLRGNSCPNCGGRGRPVATRLVPVCACSSCGVLYRPVGFRRGLPLRLYYSFVYTAAGVATSLGMDTRQESEALAIEGKDRSLLLASILPPPATICVFGCSWGYELPPLVRAGYAAVGIEVSALRRQFGRSRGLTIFASDREAAAHGVRADVVLSSHVLEHIPEATNTVRSLQERLRPMVQLHVHPSVEGYDGASRAVGREHPLGITDGFWRYTASRLGVALELRRAGEEGIAILRRGT